MEWILVLVFVFQGATAPAITTVPGFKSAASCQAALESIKAAAAAKYQASPMAVSEMYKYSICAERAR